MTSQKLYANYVLIRSLVILGALFFLMARDCHAIFEHIEIPTGATFQFHENQRQQQEVRDFEAALERADKGTADSKDYDTIDRNFT